MYNFACGLIFLRRNFCAKFFADRAKTASITNITTRKNVVPQSGQGRVASGEVDGGEWRADSIKLN